MPKIFEELDRQVDKWEPTAAAISLGSLGLGAGISTTAVGAPIGGIIAGVGQLPSLAIDGYQAGRGWYKTFKESPSNLGSAVWNTLETGANIFGAKFATALTKGGSKFLRPRVYKPGHYPKHNSSRVNAMRKRLADAILNQQKEEATKKLAKKGVRPSQGSYFISKLNQELNRSYLEQAAKRNTIIANDVIKLSPKVQLPIQIIPNIIDIQDYNDQPIVSWLQLNSILAHNWNRYIPTGHFPDEGASGTYKTKTHPTYPGLGDKSWSKDNKIYYLSKDQYIKPNSGQPLDYTMDYLGSNYDYNNGGTKVVYDGANVLPTLYVTKTKGSGFNLKPNKNINGYIYFDRKD